MPPSNVVDAERWKVEQFIRQLGTKPFMAFVFSDGDVLVFETGLTQDNLRKISSTVNELIQED